MLEFPIGSFPDLDRGLVCEYCLAGEDSAKAQQRLIAETKKMADAVLDVQGIDDLMPKIKTVMAEVYAQYGGPRGFASKIVWVIDQLCSRRPVPASAGQLLVNLMKLHQSIEASDESTKLADMSMEQLRREQELALTQLAMEAAGDPRKREVLFTLLSRQGFVIEQADPADRRENLVQAINDNSFEAKTFGSPGAASEIAGS